jgi:hypothetical protein
LWYTVPNESLGSANSRPNPLQWSASPWEMKTVENFISFLNCPKRYRRKCYMLSPSPASISNFWSSE